MFLTTALNANIRGALDPFYTGDAKCNPSGPHFDLRFYLSWSAAVGSVAGLAGIAIFQLFLARTWYRRAFWTTTLLQVAAGAMDILIVARVNLRVGISDKAAYLLGDSIVQDVVRRGDGGRWAACAESAAPKASARIVFSMGCALTRRLALPFVSLFSSRANPRARFLASSPVRRLVRLS